MPYRKVGYSEQCFYIIKYAIKERFTPLASERYEATKSKGLATALTEGAQVLECFDCPRCGCQTIAGTREQKNRAKLAEPPSTKLLYTATKVYGLKNIDGFRTRELLDKIQAAEQREKERL